MLVAGLCLSLLGIFLAIPFWLGVFPLRNQLLVLLGLPCVLLPVSPLVPLKFSLSCNFAILIMMCLAVGLFGFLFIQTLCASWICVTFFLINIGKFSIITFSNRFPIPCSSSSSDIPVIWILFRFMFSSSSLNSSSFFLSLFFLCSLRVFFPYVVLQLADSILSFI